MYKLLVYNIAYATGAPNSHWGNIFKIHRFFKKSKVQLEAISEYIKTINPDIIGLIEIDTGSIRTAKLNQAETLSKYLKHYSHSSTKYGDSLTGKVIPILRKQGNAILTKDKTSNGIYHYFPGGFKKLIIELDMADFCFFLVHLSISKRVRTIQLKHLQNLLSAKKCPLIIAGDFNTFRGTEEIEETKQALNLINPNKDHKPTFPSWSPTRELDFILCSKEIKILKFDISDIKFSDHLPLIMEFEL